MEREVRIERIEPHVGIERVKRCGAVTAVSKNTSGYQMSFCQIGRQRDAALSLRESLVVFPMPKQSYCKPDVGCWIFVVDLNCPLRDFQTGLDRPLGIFRPVIGVLDHMGGSHIGVCSSKIWIDR